jgi:hypothetical protein
VLNWLKKILVRWLLSEHEARILDLEKHFVTKRDAEGKVTETLADVPLEHRKPRKVSMAGASWTQRKNWLEVTDGGRKA